MKFNKGTKEENIKYYLLSILLVILGLFVYFYLYNQQRDIDNNLGTTKGKIIEYKMSSVQSGMSIEFTYVVKGMLFKNNAFTGNNKLTIDYNKEYIIEYSTKEPSNSRIIINGKKYSRGVD